MRGTAALFDKAAARNRNHGTRSRVIIRDRSRPHGPGGAICDRPRRRDHQREKLGRLQLGVAEDRNGNCLQRVSGSERHGARRRLIILAGDCGSINSCITQRDRRARSPRQLDVEDREFLSAVIFDDPGTADEKSEIIARPVIVEDKAGRAKRRLTASELRASRGIEDFKNNRFVRFVYIVGDNVQRNDRRRIAGRDRDHGIFVEIVKALYRRPRNRPVGKTDRTRRGLGQRHDEFELRGASALFDETTSGKADDWRHDFPLSGFWFGFRVAAKRIAPQRPGRIAGFSKLDATAEDGTHYSPVRNPTRAGLICLLTIRSAQTGSAKISARHIPLGCIMRRGRIPSRE